MGRKGTLCSPYLGMCSVSYFLLWLIDWTFAIVQHHAPIILVVSVAGKQNPTRPSYTFDASVVKCWKGTELGVLVTGSIIPRTARYRNSRKCVLVGYSFLRLEEGKSSQRRSSINSRFMRKSAKFLWFHDMIVEQKIDLASHPSISFKSKERAFFL